MLKRGLSIAMILCLAGAATAQDKQPTPDAKPPAAPVVQPKKETPDVTLKAGDKAPGITVEKWIKGEPVTGFEKGKVYVVEFWATWCGPCIASMPHISDLQAMYKDKGVTIIGTNIWEDDKFNDETYKKAADFVKAEPDRMAYTVAYDGGAKFMDKNWMKASGRNGIPSAFLVDQNGVIAWIGHPMMLDIPLDDVVNGKWDLKTGPEKVKKASDALNGILKKSRTDAKGALADFTTFETDFPNVAKHQEDTKTNLLLAAGEYDKAYKSMAVSVDAAIKSKNSMKLNSIAWTIVDPEGKIEKKDLDLALKAATAANKITDEKDGAIMDTLARCYYLKGDKAKAIELQKKAVENAQGEMKAELQKNLKEYEGAK
ncbi:MAG: redoxin family protein [Pyrinomonadaceae bacterium]|nr:redoxin family protein [Phycisphaerales bacterium]